MPLGQVRGPGFRAQGSTNCTKEIGNVPAAHRLHHRLVDTYEHERTNIMNLPLKTSLAVAILSAATAGQVYAQNIRFQGLDRNHDGVITRAEWRGNDRSFQNEDWNGDGVLSGEEV